MAWGSQTWGFANWGVLGDQNVTPTGVIASSNVSSVTTDGEVNTGWSSDPWGVELWGTSGLKIPITNTNLSMTAAEGSAGLSFDGDSNFTPTGLPLTASLNDVEAFSLFTAEVTGFPMTMELSYDPEIVTPNSLPITMNLGAADLNALTVVEVTTTSVGYWGYKSTWGFSSWGNGVTETLAMSMLENFSGVDPEPDVSLTGNAVAIALSSIANFNIIGDANLNLTGQPLTIAQGTATLTPNTQVDVTGFVLTAAVNNVSEIVGTATVIPTGFGLTNSLGTATNVLIWNEVNTGTAPVDPPGWQDVTTNAA